MIWIVAVILLLLFAAVGYQIGAVRAAISFVGLLIAAALAMPASKATKPLVEFVGVKHPFIVQMVAPAVAFLLIWIVFQIIAQAVHHKLMIFYKYKTDDKSRYKFERMNDRVGICMGLFNGAAFFILAMIPVYIFGYLTVQVASGNQDTGTIPYINKARQELKDTGFDKVVAAYDPGTAALYDAFDVAGIVYKNPVSVARLARYPAFLTLAENTEFQALADDTEFNNLWQSGATVGQMLAHPKVHTIATNVVLTKQIQDVLATNLTDLKAFLITGESQVYTESILGRWQLDFGQTINEERKNRQNMSATELRQLRARVAPFWGATLVANTDNQVLLKRSDRIQAPANAPKVMAQGTWTRDAGLYKIALDNNTMEAVIEDRNKLILPWGDLKFIFIRELQ